MNKIIKQILLPLMLILSMGSCNEDAKYYTLETPPDQMNLAASAENVILQKVDETKEAISFSWNKAADRGTDIELVYYFRLYHSEMKDLQSEIIKLGKDANSITFTVRELNNLLYSWDIAPGDEVTIEAEVLAVVDVSPEYMKPEKSLIKFNVIGYDASNKLFLTIEVDNQKRNLEMNALGENIFNWRGKLEVCDFWFVRNIDKGFPAYMKGEDESSLVYSDSGEGKHFKIDSYGNYDITVDLNSMKVVLSTPQNTLSLVVFKNGVETITTLNEVEEGTDIFYLQEEFEEGTEFRFVRDESALWPAYVKGANESKLELKGIGAEMFKVGKTATYVMTVNMDELSLIFLDVYVSPTGTIAVVGAAATDAGWDAGAAVRNCILTQKDLINRPEVISYTGNFRYTPSGSDDDNAFKFVGNDGWGHGLFAEIANANPFDSGQQIVSTNGDGDNKWKLPEGTTSGIYTLEMNLHTMKISLVK